MLSNSSLWTKSIRNLFFVAIIFVLARMCFHVHVPSRKGFLFSSLFVLKEQWGNGEDMCFCFTYLVFIFIEEKVNILASNKIAIQDHPELKIFSCELMLPGLTEMFPSTSTHILSFSIFGNPDVVDKLGHI